MCHKRVCTYGWHDLPSSPCSSSFLQMGPCRSVGTQVTGVGGTEFTRSASELQGEVAVEDVWEEEDEDEDEEEEEEEDADRSLSNVSATGCGAALAEKNYVMM